MGRSKLLAYGLEGQYLACAPYRAGMALVNTAVGEYGTDR